MQPIRLAILVLALLWQPADAAASAGSAPSQAVVRVYPDWRLDPKAYVSLTVPLAGLDLTRDAVQQEYARREAAAGKEASPGLTGAETILVVMPEDQQDQGVIDAMKGLVFSQSLRQGTLTLRPDHVPPARQKPCQFLDMADRPLANMEVAILIAQGEYTPTVERPHVWIADAQLDAEGLLLPPRSAFAVNRFSFHVLHPDCGPVFATPQYRGDDQPYHLYRVAALPREQWCAFVDALGRPMPGVWVEPITSGSWEHGRMTSPAPILLDEEGRMRPPALFMTSIRSSFVVSDPNYGIALVEPYLMTQVSVREPLKTCVVPLAPYGTKGDAGSIWGFVVDSDETPIPGAVIACMKAVQPGGGPVTPYWPWPAQWNKEAKVLTNDRGQFAMCLPHTDKNGNLGAILPAGSLYEVTVTPPAELGCQPFRGRLAAGREHVVRLEGTAGGPKKYEGTLAFEDEFGPVTDPEQISRVNLVIRAARGNLPPVTYGYPEGQWLEKSKLPFGFYEARADWDGKHYTFRMIRVTAESPEVIVFTPLKIEPFEIRYRGRVIHATSGDPIDGAVVLPSSLSDVQGLDPESFRRLEQQAGRQSVRTNPAGRYEITLPILKQPGPERTLIAIKEDYFPFQQQRSLLVQGPGDQGPRGQGLPIDKDGRTILPDLKLFPAGTVVIEPNVPQGHRGKRVALDFLISDKSPAWLKSLWISPGQNPGTSIIRRTDLIVGGPQGLCIPAYATMTLRLQLPDERYAPAFIEDVVVGQGKTAELGRIDFARTMPVAVKVVDPAGNPLEGIRVTCLTGKGAYPTAAEITDAAGVAHVPVGVRSRGRFAVQFEDRRTARVIRQEMPYEVSDGRDAGEFVLQLSDEFLQQVLR